MSLTSPALNGVVLTWCMNSEISCMFSPWFCCLEAKSIPTWFILRFLLGTWWGCKIGIGHRVRRKGWTHGSWETAQREGVRSRCQGSCLWEQPVFSWERCEFWKVFLINTRAHFRRQWNIRLYQDQVQWIEIRFPGTYSCYSHLAPSTIHIYRCPKK